MSNLQQQYVEATQKRMYQVVKGSLSALSSETRSYIEEKAAICQPDNVYICDGSEEENEHMIKTLLNNKMIEPLPKYKNWLVSVCICHASTVR